MQFQISFPKTVKGTAKSVDPDQNASLVWGFLSDRHKSGFSLEFQK